MSVSADLAGESSHLEAEIRELERLGESTQAEIRQLQGHEDAARSRYESAEPAGGQDPVGAADEYISLLGRRMTLEKQLAAMNAKRKLLGRVYALIERAQVQLAGPPSPLSGPDGSPERDDELRLPRAVVDTQEDERRHIARRVHDGPAQAMANLVLQSEISERVYDIDRDRTRTELTALRLAVSKILQELRSFVFELRPMVLDDLGLVPTMRRYIQTLTDEHGVRIDLASSGRARRLLPDDEVAVFRLIQDSLTERIERAGAKDISIAMTWREDTLETTIQSDGREQPGDDELDSGRSQRLALLRGDSELGTRADGSLLLRLRIPIRVAGPMIPEPVSPRPRS